MADHDEPAKKQAAQSKWQNNRPKRPRASMQLVDKILPSVMSGLGLDRRMKEHALMQVWPSFLPVVLSEKSRPLFMDNQQNLVISASNAAVAQEISLMKNKLLQNLKMAGRSLGVEVNGLRVEMKNYHQPQEPEVNELAPMPQANDEELNLVELGANDKQLIVDLSKQLAANSEFESSLKMKALKAYERQLRLAQWRRNMGFPICQICSNPVPRLYELDMHKLCFSCWAEAKI